LFIQINDFTRLKSTCKLQEWNQCGVHIRGWHQTWHELHYLRCRANEQRQRRTSRKRRGL